MKAAAAFCLGALILLSCNKKGLETPPKENENSGPKEIQKAGAKKDALPLSALSGIWGLGDPKKAYQFLGITKKDFYSYCMLVDAEQGKAEIHFVKQIFGKKNTYLLKIQEISPQTKPNLRRLLFAYKGKSRWATVHYEKGSPYKKGSHNDIYVYFDDSTPYKEGVDMYGSRDGSYSYPVSAGAIEKCIKDTGQDYELDKENEGMEHGT